MLAAQEFDIDPFDNRMFNPTDHMGLSDFLFSIDNDKCSLVDTDLSPTKDRNEFGLLNVSSNPSSPSLSELSDCEFSSLDGLDLGFERDCLFAPPASPRTLSPQRRKTVSPTKTSVERSSSKTTRTPLTKCKQLSFRWSDMSAEEKTEALEMLITTVSEQLGLREQLELIRLIHPNANVAPTDTEFFIDLDLFDDEKYEMAKNFVEKKLRQHNQQTTKESSISESDLAIQRNSRRKALKRKRKQPCDLDMMIKRQVEAGKLNKQQRKEKRSGLFLNEQVISVNGDTDPDADEIDILT